MATTIQINRDTHEILKQLRKSYNANSYNEVINKIVRQSISKKETLYGFLGRKSIKQILKGLRDEKDRI